MHDNITQSPTGTARAKDNTEFTFGAFLPNRSETAVIEQHFKKKDPRIMYAQRGHLDAIFERITGVAGGRNDLIELLGPHVRDIYDQHGEVGIIVLDSPEYRRYGTFFPLLHLRYGHPTQIRTARTFDERCVVLTIMQVGGTP